MGSGTLIPFPSVAPYPGVPQLNRAVNSAVASSTALTIGLGTAQSIVVSALQQPPKWGIFDSDGNQLGVNAGSSSILTAISGTLLNQLTGATPTVLSTLDFSYMAESQVSTFPVEDGGFATYNKVQMPAEPTVTLVLQGSESDRTTFLEALEAARVSTDLYDVITPECVYSGYTVERFNYQRRSSRGTTLLIVEVSLLEVRTVSAAYTTATSPALASPSDPNALPQEQNGITQPAAAPSSILNQIAPSISSAIGKMFTGGL